jgi:hypothetical protein
MHNLQPDFTIKNNGPISEAFLVRNVNSFQQATLFIAALPYGRNPNKTNLVSVFTDNCATCSTKHALLKLLATENNVIGLQLIIGLFKMNKKNTPQVAATLAKHQLQYLPEAHCYLKYNGQVLDFTNKSSCSNYFLQDILQEIEINCNQISDFKINYHKAYLACWLNENININLTVNEIWAIREQCIADLAID